MPSSESIKGEAMMKLMIAITLASMIYNLFKFLSKPEKPARHYYSQEELDALEQKLKE